MHLLLRIPIHYQVNWCHFTVLLSLFPRAFVPVRPFQGIMVARLPSLANGVKGGMYFTLERKCDIQHSALLQRRQKTTKKMVRAGRPNVLRGKKGVTTQTRGLHLARSFLTRWM